MQQIPVDSKVQIAPYIDDLMIQGKTYEEVEEALTEVNTGLQEAGYAINPKEIQGPSTTVKYLGIIWADRVQQMPEQT